MIWNPNMLLYDVLKPYGSLEKAGLSKIGKKQGKLILTFQSGEVKVVAPGEEIPLQEKDKCVICKNEVKGGGLCHSCIEDQTEIAMSEGLI